MGNKLTDALIRMGKEKAGKALLDLEKHLGFSNKPSATIMINLAKLRRGEDIGEPTYRPTKGSMVQIELEKEAKEKAEQEAKEREEEREKREQERREERERRDRERDQRDPR